MAKKPNDITGQKFGKITAVKYLGQGIWGTVCDCGKTKIVRIGRLKDGSTRSCGCDSFSHIKDLTGQRFGKLTVVSFAGKRNHSAYWNCRCDCRNDTVVQGSY